MGEALGKVYVARYFPPEAKAKAEALVANLLKAYDADIHTLDWMSPATKAKALDKLRQFTPKIGYPDQWRDYSALRNRARRPRSAMCSAPRCSNGTARSSASTSRWTAPNGA